MTALRSSTVAVGTMWDTDLTATFAGEGQAIDLH